MVRQQPVDAMDAILMAAHCLKQELDRALRKLGGPLALNYSTYRLLDYIAKHPRCSRVDMAEALGVTQGNYTGVIANLIANGYIVEVKENTYHRKTEFLILSEKAVALVARARDARYKIHEKLVGAVETESVDILEASATKMLEAFPAIRPRTVAAVQVATKKR